MPVGKNPVRVLSLRQNAIFLLQKDHWFSKAVSNTGVKAYLILWHANSNLVPDSLIQPQVIMKKIYVLAILAAVGATEVQAQQGQAPQGGGSEDKAVIQLSLTPDIALYPRTMTIDGFSLNIWGENEQHGVAFGLVNGSVGRSGGFSWGLVNYDEAYTGVQWGLVNVSNEEFVGWQRAVVNVDQGTFTGYQDGIVNVSEEVKGVQLGLVNYAQQLRGLQIGVVNVAMNNPWFDDFPDKLAPAFPIVNWSF
jgi:hypothetical protein